jgi:hypothetical protein
MGLVTIGATVSGSPIANNATINVSSPGAESYLELSGLSNTQNAGVPFNFTVTAKDRHGNTLTDYQKSIDFYSSAASASVPPRTAAKNGVAQVSATLNTSGAQSITAVGIGNFGLTRGTVNLTVLPGEPNSLKFSNVPPVVSAEDVFTLTVNAMDAFGNVVQDYNSPVSFQTDDSMAWLPPSSALVSGTGKFNFSLRSPGKIFSIVANDGRLVGSTDPISVLENTSIRTPPFLVQLTGSKTSCAGALLNINGSYRIVTAAHCLEGAVPEDLQILFQDGFVNLPEKITQHSSYDPGSRAYDVAILDLKGGGIGKNRGLRFPDEIVDSSLPAPAEIWGWMGNEVTNWTNSFSLMMEFLDPSLGPNYYSGFDSKHQNLSTPASNGSYESGIQVVKMSANPSQFGLAGLYSYQAGEGTIGLNLGASEITSWITLNGFDGSNQVIYASSSFDFSPIDFGYDPRTSGIPTVSSPYPLSDCKIRFVGGTAPPMNPDINPNTCEISNYFDAGYGVCGGEHGVDAGSDYEVTPYFDGNPGQPVILRLYLGWDWSGPC